MRSNEEPTSKRTVTFFLTRGPLLIATALAPVPLIFDLKLGIGMASSAPITWPLSVLLVVAAALLARREHDRVLVCILLIALLAGTIATTTYDAFRLAGLSAGIVPMDEAFGFGQRLMGEVTRDEMPPATGTDEHGPGAGVEEQAAHSSRGLATLLGYLITTGME